MIPSHNHPSTRECEAGCPFYDNTHRPPIRGAVAPLNDCTPQDLAAVWRAHADRCDEAATYHRRQADNPRESLIATSAADHYLLAVRNGERAALLRSCADEMLRRLK